jgi:exopolysaccharide production protein ExoY
VDQSGAAGRLGRAHFKSLRVYVLNVSRPQRSGRPRLSRATQLSRAPTNVASVRQIELVADRVHWVRAPSLHLTLHTWPMGDATRRAMDVLGAVVGIVLASPLLILCALVIRLGDGGPVIHRRRVLGLNGQEFNAFKLRTMRIDADAWLAQRPDLLAEYQKNTKLSADPRITCIGRVLRKFSVDELPQLWNVFRGHMSLVGPRIIHASELERYGDFGPTRLKVNPGLTGLWQVHGRQQGRYEERIRLDREYIEKRSLWLDLKVLVWTIPAVLRGRGGC